MVTCARGSSDHAATFAKYLIETRAGRADRLGRAVGQLDLRAPTRLDGAVCLAISQSGRSPDLLAAVEAAKRAGALVVALVNVEDSPLAALADEVAAAARRAGDQRRGDQVLSSPRWPPSLQLVADWTEDDELAAALAQACPTGWPQAWALDWSRGRRAR